MMPVALTVGPEAGLVVARIRLNRPERANSLVPELVGALNAAIGRAAEAPVGALVLEGEGRFFSSGGDVAGFRDATDLPAYADRLVGGLQEAVRSLLAFPAPVIAKVEGGVTGGAAGLILAADLVAMDEGGFLQPYYTEMGFAPDGGWTALLPEKVSPAAALRIQLLNQRVSAADALALGLVQAVALPGDLEVIVRGWLEALAGKSAPSLSATRRLIWDEARLAAVTQRLAAERRAFLALIAEPDTRERMSRFLAARSEQRRRP